MRTIRLRIRDKTDATDLLSVSTDDYISSIPGGVGLEINPLDGSMVAGQTTVQVIDTLTSPTVTAVLANVNNRLALLGLKAIVEINDGSGYTTLQAGFVTAVTLITGAEYEIQIGDSRRAELSTKLTTIVHSGTIFGNVRSLIPISVPDFVGSGREVQLNPDNGIVYINSGSVPPGVVVSTPRQIFFERNFGNTSVIKIIGPQTRDAFPTLDQQKAYIDSVFPLIQINSGGEAVLPGVTIKLQNASTGEIRAGQGMMIHQNQGPVVNLPVQQAALNSGVAYFVTNQGRVKVTFDSLPPATSTASSPVRWNVWAYKNEVSDKNPLIVTGHPVDILRDAAIQLGEPFTAASQVAMKNELNPSLYFSLRFTESRTYQDIERMLFSFLGLNKRPAANGQWELIETRRPNTDSVSTITINELRSLDPPIWASNESSIVNRVEFEESILKQWTDKFDQTVRTPDGLIVTKHTHQIDTEEADLIVRDKKYTIPGQIYLKSGTSYAPIEFDEMTEAMARHILHRYVDGGIITELQCVPSVTTQVGDEVNVTLDSLPIVASNIRGGTRRMLVLKRSETPVGPDLKCIDTASTAAVGVVPTFTLAIDPNDPKHSFVVTLTNVGSLTDSLEVEVAVGPTQPTGSGNTVRVFESPYPSTFVQKPYPQGSKVWVRMRLIKPGSLPGTYSAWQSISLNAILTPTSLSASVLYNNVTLTWTNTENMLMVLELQNTGQPESRHTITLLDTRISIFALNLPFGSYDVFLRYDNFGGEAGPYATTSFSVADILFRPPKPFIGPMRTYL